MKCDKCQGSKITAMRSHKTIYDAVEYIMECKDCGHKWWRKRGYRVKPTPEMRKEWENVEFVENRFEREGRIRSEKVDRGECPNCGGKLKTVVLSRGRLVDYRTDCESGCGFKSEGNALPEYFDKKMKNLEGMKAFVPKDMTEEDK